MPSFISNRFMTRGAVASSALIAASFAATTAHACPDWSQTGQQIDFSSNVAPQTLPVVAGGSNDLSGCPMPGNGFVATTPDFDLNFSNPAGGALEISVTAQCDSVLLVNDAAGQWHFNDDDTQSQTLNSRLVIENAPAGAYDIWVGTYGPDTCQSTMTLAMAGALGAGAVPGGAGGRCPDPAQNGLPLAVNHTAPLRAEVIAGGDIDMSTCPETRGHGYVIEQPDFTVALADNPGGGALNLRVESQCDPVMLVAGPNGMWRFNDDGNDLNPSISLEGAAPGEYDVWVGTYGPQTCAATLVVESEGMQTQLPAAGGSGGKPGDAPSVSPESEPEPLDEGK